MSDERRGPDPEPGDPGPRPSGARTPIEIENPSHYTYAPGFEPWDVIEAWGLGFNLGNVVKYIARHRHKGTPLEDLQKARVYLEREIMLRVSGKGSRPHDRREGPSDLDVTYAWDLPERDFLDYLRGQGISCLNLARDALDRWIAQEEANR